MHLQMHAPPDRSIPAACPVIGDAPATSGVALQVEGIRVDFGIPQRPRWVLDGLNFELAPGEIGCLLGESGCGKSTALRTIAGFIAPAFGRIVIGGQTMTGPDRWVEPEARRTGVVFQDYALFPHLDVAANVGFGLKKMARSARAGRVAEMLALVGLEDLGRRYPHELSGGQQQRVALARALAPAPALLLLDEPFSNLDPDLRERLAFDLRELLKRAGTTALLVTHDQYEAFALADSVGMMSGGRIVQWDTPYELYHRPSSRAVADFVGLGAFLPGRVMQQADGPTIRIELGDLPIRTDDEQQAAAATADEAGAVTVLLRPDDVVHDDSSPVQATVIRKAFRGAQFLYTLKLPSGSTLLALVPSHHDHPVGEQIGIRFDADHVVTFERVDAG
jgi:iron(III) transport system ATP-binding protein